MRYTRAELGEYIKQQRRYFKLSQEQVAKMAKVSKQCVLRIEKGKNSYPYIVNTILKVLCIDPKSITIIE